jgi:hypothetical protein
MKTTELLDAARLAIACNDAELARRVQIGRSMVADIRAGRTPLPDRATVILARLAGLDPATVLAEIRAEQAGPEVAPVWKEIARRAALTALTVAALGAGWQVSGPAYAIAEKDHIYIMSSRKLRALPLPLHPCPQVRHLPDAPHRGPRSPALPTGPR